MIYKALSLKKLILEKKLRVDASQSAKYHSAALSDEPSYMLNKNLCTRSSAG